MTEALSLYEILRRFETAAIETALAITCGNITKAAILLNLKRTTLIQKMIVKGINEKKYQKRAPTTPQELSARKKYNRHANLRSNVLKYEMIRYSIEILEKCDWCRTKAANQLGISLRCMRNYCRDAKAFGIDVKPSEYKRQKKQSS
jgi:DNA-binding NtrC family response regulator